MAETLVAHNYYLEFDPAERDAVRPWAPLGPLYAASALRARGVPVDFWDATFARSEGEFERAVDRLRPRVVVLMADPFNVPQKMCLRRMRQAAMAMIAASRRVGARVVVAGPDPASYPAEYLTGGADYLVAGEAEGVLTEAVPRLLAGDEARDVAGITWLGPSGQVERAAERPRIGRLEQVPLPARDLVDMPRYLEAWRRRHGFGVANLVTSRGCPYPCNWCAKPVYGRRYALRSPEDVVAEVKELKETYGADRLWFADEVFGLEKRWLARFRERVLAERAVVPYEALSRVDLVDDAVASDLRASGCTSLWMGAESGSQRILDAMEKGTRVEEIRAAREALGRQGIEVGFFLQFGYPGEEMADIDRTLAMVKEAAPDRIGISVSYPLPGTPFYERVRTQQKVERGWQHSMECELLHVSTFGPDFYKVLRRLVHKEFALQRSRREFLAEVRRVPKGDLAALRRLPRLAWQSGGKAVLRSRLRMLARRGNQAPA